MIESDGALPLPRARGVVAEADADLDGRAEDEGAEPLAGRRERLQLLRAPVGRPWLHGLDGLRRRRAGERGPDRLVRRRTGHRRPDGADSRRFLGRGLGRPDVVEKSVAGGVLGGAQDEVHAGIAAVGDPRSILRRRLSGCGDEGKGKECEAQHRSSGRGRDDAAAPHPLCPPGKK